jgi:GxxExxY protein
MRSWTPVTGFIRTLGPGLPESVYEAALGWEPESRGFAVIHQPGIPVVYGDVHIHKGFFADLIVNDQVIVEIKSVEMVAPVHKRQLLTYRKWRRTEVDTPHG